MQCITGFSLHTDNTCTPQAIPYCATQSGFTCTACSATYSKVESVAHPEATSQGTTTEAYTSDVCGTTAAACVAVVAPTNGALGTCTGAAMAHGATCQTTCNDGYASSGAATTCLHSVLTTPQCGIANCATHSGVLCAACDTGYMLAADRLSCTAAVITKCFPTPIANCMIQVGYHCNLCGPGYTGHAEYKACYLMPVVLTAKTDFTFEASAYTANFAIEGLASNTEYSCSVGVEAQDASTASAGALYSAPSAAVSMHTDTTLPGTFAFLNRNGTVREDAGTFQVCVERTVGASGQAEVRVRWQTEVSGCTDLGSGCADDLHTLTFANGEKGKCVNVVIVDDAVYQGPSVTYWAEIEEVTPAGAIVGATSRMDVFVTDDDDAGIIRFGNLTFSASEGVANGIFTLPVLRDLGTSGFCEVEYRVRAYSQSAAGIVITTPAAYGLDYVNATGTFSFNDGVSAASIPVSIVNDAIYDPNEQFTVKLVSIRTLESGAVIDVGRNLALVTIDDDGDQMPPLQPPKPTFRANDLTGGMIKLMMAAPSNIGGNPQDVAIEQYRVSMHTTVNVTNDGSVNSVATVTDLAMYHALDQAHNDSAFPFLSWYSAADSVAAHSDGMPYVVQRGDSISSLEVAGLSADTQYLFSVAVRNNGRDQNYSVQSEILDVTTLQQSAPTVPQNLVQSQIAAVNGTGFERFATGLSTGGSIRLDWVPPIDRGGVPLAEISYTLYSCQEFSTAETCSTLADLADVTNRTCSQANTVEVGTFLGGDLAGTVYELAAYSKLHVDCPYRFRVKAAFGDFRSEQSPWVEARTAPVPTLPGQPATALYRSQVQDGVVHTGGQINLVVSRPRDEGGTPILGYAVAIKQDDVWVDCFFGTGVTTSDATLQQNIDDLANATAVPLRLARYPEDDDMCAPTDTVCLRSLFSRDCSLLPSTEYDVRVQAYRNAPLTCTAVDMPYAGCTAAACTAVDTPYAGCIDTAADASTVLPSPWELGEELLLQVTTAKPSIPGPPVIHEQTFSTGGHVRLSIRPSNDFGGIAISSYEWFVYNFSGSVGSDNYGVTPCPSECTSPYASLPDALDTHKSLCNFATSTSFQGPEGPTAQIPIQFHPSNTDGSFWYNASVDLYHLRANSVYRIFATAKNVISSCDTSNTIDTLSLYFDAHTAAPTAPTAVRSLAHDDTAPSGGTCLRVTWMAPIDTGGNRNVSYYKVALAAGIGTSTACGMRLGNSAYALPRYEVMVPAPLADKAHSCYPQATYDYSFGYLCSNSAYHVSVSAVSVVHDSTLVGEALESPVEIISVSTSDPSSPGAPIDTPTMPTSTTASSATVEWAPPADTGGAPVRTYTVYYKSVSTGLELSTLYNSSSAGNMDKPTGPLRITGLAADTTYEVQVAAETVAGLGAKGAALSLMTAQAVPPADPTPPQVTASSGGGVSLELPPPADTGGSALTAIVYQLFIDGVLVLCVRGDGKYYKPPYPAPVLDTDPQRLHDGGPYRVPEQAPDDGRPPRHRRGVRLRLQPPRLRSRSRVCNARP